MLSFIKKHWKGFLIGLGVILSFIGGLLTGNRKQPIPGANTIKQLDKSNAGLAATADSAVGQLKATNAEVSAGIASMDKLAQSSNGLVEDSEALIREANGGPASGH